MIDFVGDGTPGLIVNGHRENFNAHSFDVVSFYVQVDIAGSTRWNIVPIIDESNKRYEEKFEVMVSGGADCLLNDFRLLAKHAEQPATLIIAERTMGDSYLRKDSVTFHYFPLVHHADGSPGSVPYAFELTHSEKAKANYCDVGEAFQKELGLGKP